MIALMEVVVVVVAIALVACYQPTTTSSIVIVMIVTSQCDPLLEVDSLATLWLIRSVTLATTTTTTIRATTSCLCSILRTIMTIAIATRFNQRALGYFPTTVVPPLEPTTIITTTTTTTTATARVVITPRMPSMMTDHRIIVYFNPRHYSYNSQQHHLPLEQIIIA